MNPDSPWLRGGLVLAAVFLVQEAVLRTLHIDGVRPDLVLGLALVVAVVAGPEAGAVLGFAGGVLADLFVNTPFGLTALVACVVAFAAGSVQQALGANHRWVVPVLAALGSAAAEVAWAMLGTVLGLPGLLHPRLVVVAVVVATVNAAVSAPWALLARWIYGGAPAGAARGYAG